jgi:hypothetical protein
VRETFCTAQVEFTRVTAPVAANQRSMQRWIWLSGAALAAILCAAWLWTRAPLARGLDDHGPKLHADNTLDAESAAPRSAMPAGSVTHTDPEKRAQLRRRLLPLRVERTHDSVRRALGAAPIAQRPARTAEDGKLLSAFIEERVRPDLTYRAQTCYKALLERSPNAQGDLTLSFEFLAERELGGIINGFLIRSGTLNEETFTACLRDSFLSLYFDPPPGGGRATANLRFHFEAGSATNEPALVDRHGGRESAEASSAAKPE